MTAQAKELIKYKGKTYVLKSNPWVEELLPLTPLLKERKIHPIGYSSVCQRGYIGIWEIIENKLYLLNIEESRISMNSIFGDSNRQIASWFSGIIEFGFGNYSIEYLLHPTYFFENSFWFKIENGVVVQRKIIKNIEEN